MSVKKLKPYFKGSTEKAGGVIKFAWDDGEEDRFKRYLATLQYKNAKTKVKVTVERFRNDASTQQFRYLWGVVYPILGDHFGYDHYEYREWIHNPLKAMFLGYKEVEQKTIYRIIKDPLKPINATVVELISTTELDTGRMTEFIDNVRRWAKKEYDIHIPAPNEVDYDDMIDELPEF